MSIRYHKPVTNSRGEVFVYKRELFTPIVSTVAVLAVLVSCVYWVLQDFGVIR